MGNQSPIFTPQRYPVTVIGGRNFFGRRSPLDKRQRVSNAKSFACKKNLPGVGAHRPDQVFCVPPNLGGSTKHTLSLG
uniref:hypothetical protein n=1 Tax=Edwardsiella piscicida TaxID=1263550 RepID=UPI001868C835|nr:hypothetical protein [Edwardsiella piscicida]